MSTIKPSDHGIVVEHKESGARYASLDANFDPDNERRIRDLRPGETVLSYSPKRAESLGGETEAPGAPGTPEEPAKDLTESSATLPETPKTTPAK